MLTNYMFIDLLLTFTISVWVWIHESYNGYSSNTSETHTLLELLIKICFALCRWVKYRNVMEKTQSGSVKDNNKSCFRGVTSSALFFMQPAAPITCHLPLCTLLLQTAYHFQVFEYKRGEWAVFRISSSINIYLPIEAKS